LLPRERSGLKRGLRYPQFLHSPCLVATLLHLDKFHFNSPDTIAQSAAWFWLAIYAFVPPLMLVMWYRQSRVSGDEPERTSRLLSVVRFVLLIQALIMLAWGIGLFVRPTIFASSWPWKLTPLTSQAVGAWLIGIGVFAAHSVVENEYGWKVGMVSYLAFALLEIITLLHYPGSLSLISSSTWLYLASIISVLFAGAYLSKRGS
jgi:hypothetical protein